MSPRAARLAVILIAGFYAYGAVVHVLNIASLTGFHWLSAPLKWQVLDLVYLVLDIAVVAGLLVGARFGVVAFFCAALSQIVLYTVLRGWILDVPAEVRPPPDAEGYLDMLVVFHVVTILVMAAVLRARVQRSPRR